MTSLAETLRRAEDLLDSNPRAAAEQAREIIQRQSANVDAYRLLGAALRRLGLEQEAEKVEMDGVLASARHPVLTEASRALVRRDPEAANHLLRPYCDEQPNDAGAMRLLANAALMKGHQQDAEALLRQAVTLVPAFTAARMDLARTLSWANRQDEALAQLDEVLGREPEQPEALSLKTTILVHLGAFEEAIPLCEQTLRAFPREPQIWMSYGHLLKTVGRVPDGIAAYRKSLELRPTQGIVWWSLANLKTVQLNDEDVAAMSDMVQRGDVSDHDRFHLHFSLGKAFQDRKDWERSFSHFAEGNRIRRRMLAYDPGRVTRHADQSVVQFTRAFFAERANHGSPAPDPIFIIGMPRAGSTLVEQILASHPLIEGTMELPDLLLLAQRVSGSDGAPLDQPYLGAVAALGPEQCKALGESYLATTRTRRKTDRPFFTDKMPDNWLHLGLIHLTLPNAKIIDVRRHPMGCCFSNFTQHFEQGQEFSYDLGELGRYYRDYLRMLAHFDVVLPGRVHRLVYEDLVADPEGEIRRLLDYVGVPFDEACLAFHENSRAVNTPSSEQVRQPINRQGMERWRPYEKWLGPLKDSLGSVLDTYPDAPPSLG